MLLLACLRVARWHWGGIDKTTMIASGYLHLPYCVPLLETVEDPCSTRSSHTPPFKSFKELQSKNSQKLKMLAKFSSSCSTEPSDCLKNAPRLHHAQTSIAHTPTPILNVHQSITRGEVHGRSALTHTLVCWIDCSNKGIRECHYNAALEQLTSTDE